MSNQSTNNVDELLRQFLDGDLSPEQERNTLLLIAEDDEMRELLRFNGVISNSLKDSFTAGSFAVPEGFTDDVMSEILQLEETSIQKKTWAELLSEKLEALFTPREFSFRPATLLAVPALILIAFTALYPTLTLQPGESVDYAAGTQVVSSQESEDVWIRFVYIDEEASRIAVAGNFSDWEPIELDSRVMNGKTVWTALVPVQRGEHRYMFIRDGEEWISDPLAEIQRDDGFGNKNAVIYL